MRFGPMIPIGVYHLDQLIIDPFTNKVIWGYPHAKTGISSELGCHFYLGPSVFKDKIRIGLDVTFLNFSFNRTVSDDLDTWFWFVSQKIGPIVTWTPMENLFLDLGIKMVPVVGLHDETYGRHINEEIVVNIRYRQATISFQVDPGKIRYTDFKNKGGDLISISTFRVLIGMKF